MQLAYLLKPTRLADVSITTAEQLIRHRALLYAQIRLAISGQHAGHVAGTMWTIVHPVFLVIVYATIFGIVFQARIGGTYEMPLNYTVYILSGVIPWLAAQQAMTGACTALTGSANLIKQVVFPTEVLPARAVLVSFVPFGILIAALIVYTLISGGTPTWTYLLFPPLLLMQTLWWLGMGFLLASISVFVRDVRELVQMFSLAGLFLAPIIYLPQWVPAAFKPILYINPFSYLIWCYRDVFYFGRIEHPWSWLFVAVFSVGIYALGARVFQALKPYYGDLL